METGPGQEEKKIGGKIPFPVLIIVILKHRNNGSRHDYIRRIWDDILDEIQGDLRGKTNPVTRPTVHGIGKTPETSEERGSIKRMPFGAENVKFKFFRFGVTTPECLILVGFTGWPQGFVSCTANFDPIACKIKCCKDIMSGFYT